MWMLWIKVATVALIWTLSISPKPTLYSALCEAGACTALTLWDHISALSAGSSWLFQ